MTKEERFQNIFNELCSQYGLYVERIGNQQRAWFQTYDFVMNLNVDFTDEHGNKLSSFQIPTKVMLNDYMEVPRFFSYIELNNVNWTDKEIIAKIDEVFGEYKRLLVEAKVNEAHKDFE